ncbi:hypothetical protein [Rhodococcus spongiicola]|uniref:Uncharacterized protein n=1 Tax=Rhodococcus spongiicola TaxID=2487352 RepID=A0A438B0M5_9NOCA|nr:hypothetical protein [Rhodococcus spongiicola]RVW04457.1 hypothetical protein EF834_05070 [Rhodococcus spongiicola]
MSARESAHDGAPRWIDSQTSDVDMAVLTTLGDVYESRYSTGRFGSDGFVGSRVAERPKPVRTANG